MVDTCILREGGLHHAEIKTVMGAAVPAPDGRAGPNRTYAVDLARRATVADLLAEGVTVTPVTALCVGIHCETLTGWPPSTE